MDEHFRAFSFVDRIHSVQPGVQIRGSYAIPSGIADFPPSLVAEAVGQVAAWASLAAVGFKCRPVAGLAAKIELLSQVRPGQVLELAADLESVDTEAVAYGGTAHADGKPVILLQHCVGPMMPIEDFDDPQLLRDRFALLQGAGATPGAFGGVPHFPLKHSQGETGKSLRATLHVPVSAPFFGDHFPRRPVFPGTLLMNANLELVALLAAQLPSPVVAPKVSSGSVPRSDERGYDPAPVVGCRWTLRSVSDVKLRAFTPPGETLDIEARLNQLSTDTAIVRVETRKGRRVISGARVLLAPEGPGCPPVAANVSSRNAPRTHVRGYNSEGNA